jgi:putative glutamine amidotransferase
VRARPLVAITGPKRAGVARFFIALSVWLAGGRPKLFLTGRSAASDPFDALIISGGNDLEHQLYENDFCDLEEIIDAKRDAHEYALLHRALEEGRPVFGICRGYQLLNVYFGGSLDKDISVKFGPIRYSLWPWKRIALHPHSFLYRSFHQQRISINTLHHQAVEEAAPEFFVAAVDTKGMVQAIEHERLPLFGVQWHPEYLIWRRSQLQLFKNFVSLARRPEHEDIEANAS